MAEILLALGITLLVLIPAALVFLAFEFLARQFRPARLHSQFPKQGANWLI